MEKSRRAKSCHNRAENCDFKSDRGSFSFSSLDPVQEREEVCHDRVDCSDTATENISQFEAIENN
jgi:hypothetical protein